MGQYFAHDEIGAANIDSHAPLPVVDADGERIVMRVDPRVVDDNVDRSESGQGLLHEARDVCLLFDIGDDPDDRDALALSVVHHVVQATSGRRHDGRAGPCQRKGVRAADTPAGANDQRDPAVEFSQDGLRLAAWRATTVGAVSGLNVNLYKSRVNGQLPAS